MSNAQYEKLEKLLALTTSSNDNEALAAIRQANKILRTANKTWADVVSGNTTEISNRYIQLHTLYLALAKKYNELLRLVAMQQALTAMRAPPKRIFRKRMSRL